MGSNTLADNSEGWPQRLLRVEDDVMISYERTLDNIYGGVSEPKYNIITYTWGRFECFTVDDFAKVIRKVGREFGWVWIDIACIDQRDDSYMKKIEIGRQAMIFNRAEKVYIWFHSLNTQRLQQYITKTNQSGAEIAYTAATANGRKAFVLSTLQNLQGWFNDPWWSSLWTLQEAYLRGDAYLLSRSAEEATLYGHAAWLFQLTSDCSNIFRKTVKLIEETEHSAYMYEIANLEKIRDIIKRSGCYALYSLYPTALYGAVQARRQTHTVDRIYRIMQVYGLKLGESTDTKRTFTLSELELQLAQALNRKSPVLAQMFVHLQLPTGPSWAISEACETPERGQMCTKPEPFGEIVFSSLGELQPATASYRGMSCALATLADLWEAASSTPGRPGDSPVQSVHLDATVKATAAAIIPRQLLTLNLTMDQSQHRLVRLLLESCTRSPLQVLLLGRFTGGVRGRIVKFWHGLIVHPACGSEDTLQWARIGFCIWECTPDHDPSSENAGPWTQFSGLLV